MTVKEIYEAIEKTACECRGYWHNGAEFEGTLAEACKEAQYIYASANELEANGVSFERKHPYKDERIFWVFNNRGYAEPMPEVTEIILRLMFKASGISTKL